MSDSKPTTEPTPKPKVDKAAHDAFVPTIATAQAARDLVGRGVRSPFATATDEKGLQIGMFIPVDIAAVILSYCSIIDLCKLRATCSGVLRYLQTLPLKVTFPRHFNNYQQHVFLRLFPSVRTLKFELLPKTNIDGWKLIFSVLDNPQLDVSNVVYDVLLDKAGRDLVSIGKYHQARMCYERALSIEKHKDDDILHHNLGTVLHYLGDYTSAHEHLKFSYSKSPDAKTTARLGDCLVGLGRMDEGMKLFDEAVNMKEGADNALHIRAKMFTRIGKTVEAITDYTKLVDPSRDKVDETIARECIDLMVKNGMESEAAAVRKHLPEPMVVG